MRTGNGRWHEVSASDFAHEKQGLDDVRALLPDRAPFHAWSNFEFRDGQGKWHEVDLLVLGERRLHLVELKHYQGRIGGTAYRWERGSRSEDSPLLLARRKAQRLASVLRDAAKELDPPARGSMPFVQECVFLHADNARCLLPPGDRTDLFGLDGHERETGLPGIQVRLLERPDDRSRQVAGEADVLRAVERAGFAVRREREVGSWRLVGQPTAEGDGWQDWPAEHRLTHDPARVRFHVSSPGASDAERRGRRRLAEREYALTHRLQHAGVLSPCDIVEDDLGIGLVFPVDKKARRLDLWLADAQGGSSLRTQVGLVRQLAEALDYAHGNNVVHRQLNPRAVQVTEQRDGSLTARVGDWQVAGQAGDADSRLPSTSGSATRILGALSGRSTDPEDRVLDAYVAPEGQWLPDADRVRLDVFALGAVAYHVVAGRPPASSSLELRQRVGRDDGLDLLADLPEVPASLRRLVREATRPRVGERLRDVSAFVALLSDAERELASDEAGEPDPLDAKPGVLLAERFEVMRRLGSGSTAVGLLVADRLADGEHRVLKVAVDDAAAARLDDEADVLRALGKARHPRVVRLVEDRPARIGPRTALVLESAGEETLADVLGDRPRLSLDLLERWGTDLLDALVALDEAGIDHRDVKPANLGVREQRSDRAKHLVLFDFSLARAGATSIGAGTPPYLDPFLGTGTRVQWDSAAERYAAAVTLFEMATGHTPAYGDPLSNPAVVPDEATVEPGDFDPSVADRLVPFFRRALARDARSRFDTAADMRAAWRAAVTGAVTTLPDEALADRATETTPLAESGLSARALSALEPFHLRTAGDLAALDAGRLRRLRGVASSTKLEVQSQAKQWRERFAAQPPGPLEIEVAAGEEGSVLADPALTAMSLVEVAAGSRARSRRRAAAVLLGLEGEVPAFATLAQLAPHLGLGGAPQVSIALAKVRDAWADDDHARAVLDGVADAAVAALDGLDGAAWTDTLVATLVESLVDPEHGVDERYGQGVRRVVAGLVRAALDRADDRERGGGEAAAVTSRRRRADARVMLALSHSLAEAGVRLGDAADRMLDEAGELGEVVVPAGRAAQRLRGLWPDGSRIDDAPLVRLAARCSATAAASAVGELYPRDMHPLDAVRVAVRVSSGERLGVDEVRHRVRVRLPGLADLPGRPALDALLRDAGTGLEWDGAGYAVPSPPTDTTQVSRTGPGAALALGTPASPELASLWRSLEARSFLALGVPASRLDRAAHDLTERFGARMVDVTGVLLGALRDEADRTGVPWDQVTTADAAEPGSTPARGLAELVRRCVPAVEEAVASAMTGAAEGTRPVLLTEAAPLARYRHLGVVARLADITLQRAQAVWLLLPLEPDRGATLDGVPLPLSYASQLVVLDRDLAPGAAP
jgi:serine/threonine protein kinase